MNRRGVSSLARVSTLSRHLDTNACIGEMENREVDESEEGESLRVRGKSAQKHNGGGDGNQGNKVFKYRFTRHSIKITFPDPTAADERYGGSGDVAIIEGELLKSSTKSDLAVIFMHPSGIQNLLPMCVALARAGIHVVCCASRYPNNDTTVIMEKVVMDLGACVRHLKEKLGYQKVVLAGWSGGGSLSCFYQSQAEKPTITVTPAGDKVDLKEAKLIPADGLMILAAHTSRARIFSEWIDPAVMDEKDPSKREPTLDLYNPQNPNKPPFSKEYIRRFREAQLERNRRITKWCQEQLKEINENWQTGKHKNDWQRMQRDRVFIVHCTQADPRRIDLTIDPNGREPASLEALASENHSPVGLARFSTCRSWLSQWSYDLSNADGPKSLRNTTVPTLVLANEADHLVPLGHPQDMYDAIPHQQKEMIVVQNATHYYFGQRKVLEKAAGQIVDWLRRQHFLEPEFVVEENQAP